MDTLTRIWDHFDPKVSKPFICGLAFAVVLYSTGDTATALAVLGAALGYGGIGYTVPNKPVKVELPDDAEPEDEGPSEGAIADKNAAVTTLGTAVGRRAHAPARSRRR
jgi:hypothetical protein